MSTMAVRKEDKLNCTSITDFYAGKSVFITGGTGFLGKVLIEKLLYSCPDIDKVFVLTRSKAGLGAEQRLASIIGNPLFQRLKETRPEDIRKIIPIPGDILKENLGLNSDNEAILKEKVSVVFHGAASVKFNEPLKNALKVNYEGTEKVLNLCKRMKKIEILVHISTAYSQCNKSTIEEVVYPAPANIHDIYSYIKQNEAIISIPELMNGLPNTYTFSKALAESLVADARGDIPVVIVRPSIVTSILKEPVEGWLDNWYGASSICDAFAVGYNRTMLGPGDNIIDLIPVDYVANSCIVAAARNASIKGIAVYNSCSGSSNPTTLGELIGTFVKEAIKHRTYLLPFPELYIIPKYNILVIIISTLFQIIPAYVIDFLGRFFGKAPRFVKIQQRLSSIRDAQMFFSCHSWIMKNDQLRRLHSSLSITERSIFPMDPNDIDWKLYLPSYYAGVQKYLKKL